jgi:hypothetical protein
MEKEIEGWKPTPWTPPYTRDELYDICYHDETRHKINDSAYHYGWIDCYNNFDDKTSYRGVTGSPAPFNQK